MNCPEEAVDLVVVHELCHIREKTMVRDSMPC